MIKAITQYDKKIRRAGIAAYRSRERSDCQSRYRWFEPRSGHILSFKFGHEKKTFYDHSHPSTDLRRAVVSYWRKNGH